VGDPIPIDDPGDPRLADFAADDPRRRRAEIERAAADAGYVVLEGPVLVRRLAASGRRARAVVVTPAQEAALRDVLGAIDAPVYVAPQPVLEALVGFRFHRGALASAERFSPLGVAALARGARRLAVLEGIADLENLGAIFRNAAAFALDGVLLDPTCADPLYRRALRVAVGHTLTVPFARADRWPEALDELRAAGFVLAALTPAGDVTLADVRRQVASRGAATWRDARVALLLGSEGPGLSAAALARADLRVRIPLAPAVDSLNVAAASALAFAEVADDAALA
jgi:tRNA G18 (ribose-2'-O)-methylase SpoU